MKCLYQILNILVSLMVFLYSTSYSQEKPSATKIIAAIQGLDDDIVPLGHITLLALPDSGLVFGEYFVDGHLETSVNPDQEYLLKISALGFDELLLKIFPKDSILNLGVLALQPNTMQTIEVMANKNLVEKRNGMDIIGIKGTSMESLGSAFEVLKSLPRVVTSSQNEISLIGKGKALIYVDGQLLSTTQVLQNIAANEILAVEIIENPSAKYDAEGQAVINIKTNRKSLDGYKWSLTQEGTKGKFYRGYLKAHAYYRKRRFMCQLSFGLRTVKYGARNHYGRSFRQENQSIEIDNKYDFTVDQSTYDYSLKASYDIDPKNKIDVHYRGNKLRGNKIGLNKNVFDIDLMNHFRMNTSIIGPLHQLNNTVNITYKRAIDSLGSKLLISGQYANFQSSRLENIRQLFLQKEHQEELFRRTTNGNTINLATLQLDWQKKGRRNHSSENGMKITRIANGSFLAFEGADLHKAYYLIPEFSTNYDYHETILAAYSQHTWNLARTTVSTGLRSEWTEVKGIAMGSSVEKLSNRYLNLFPSFNISNQLKDDLKATISYNYKIQRPTFQDLNPFTFYVDSLVSFKGNPQLKPSYSHNVSLKIDRENLSLRLFHSKTRDPINTVIIVKDPQEPSIFDFKRHNIIGTILHAISVDYSVAYASLSSYLSITGRLETHTYKELGKILSNRTPGIYLYTNHSIKLPFDVTLGIQYQYTSQRVDGLYTDDPISAFNISLSRKFLKNRLTVRALGNDIFDDFRFTGTARVLGDQFTYLSEGDFQYFTLSLMWDFGRLKTNAILNSNISQDEINRISQFK